MYVSLDEFSLPDVLWTSMPKQLRYHFVVFLNTVVIMLLPFLKLTL